MALLKSIGLMSGTSLDGVDVAIIDTDGKNTIKMGETLSYSYDPSFKKKLRDLLDKDLNVDGYTSIEKELTLYHVDAVNSILKKSGLKSSDIDVIGFHGQTLKHDPASHFTLQIGDGNLLSKSLGIKVVYDFRNNDIKNGGQGAPLAPLYHKAIIKNKELPIAVINIGGVSNITWLSKNIREMIAFDTGPGNAIIDDYVYKFFGKFYDKGGEIGRTGKINQAIIDEFLTDEYFKIIPPKSLDRNHFNYFKHIINELKKPEDIIATTTEITAKTIAYSVKSYLPEPVGYYLTGGGRHNEFLIDRLKVNLSSNNVFKIDELGLNGDMLEAQAFAYLAVRSIYNLPLTYPKTTGVTKPVTGGVLIDHKNNESLVKEVV